MSDLGAKSGPPARYRGQSGPHNDFNDYYFTHQRAENLLNTQNTFNSLEIFKGTLS